MNAEEEWRTIPGFSRYKVSSLGRVLSHAKGAPRILAPAIGSKGYQQVGLAADDGRMRTCRVHQLVSAAFIGPCPPGLQVRHLDGNHLRNVPSNLAYGTNSDNTLDMVQHGRHRCSRRTHCPQGHPYDEQNTRIQVKGSRTSRVCRTCSNERRNARRRRQQMAA